MKIKFILINIILIHFAVFQSCQLFLKAPADQMLIYETDTSEVLPFIPVSDLSVNCYNYLKTEEYYLHASNGCRLFIKDTGGDGDLIIILHSGGQQHGYMLDAFAYLTEHGYRLIFYDQRGSMRSECNDIKDVTVENHINDLEFIRNFAGQKKVILAAHSFGGYLAMAYHNKFPQNVKSMILISSVPVKGNIDQLNFEKNISKRQSRSETNNELKKNGLNTDLQKLKTHQDRSLWHRITQASVNLHDVSKWKSLSGAFFYNEKAGQATLESMTETSWDFTESLNRSKVKINFIHGDDDFVSHQLHYKPIVEVPGAALHLIKNAGHLPWIDQTAVFRSILGKIL